MMRQKHLRNMRRICWLKCDHLLICILFKLIFLCYFCVCFMFMCDTVPFCYFVFLLFVTGILMNLFYY
jgi:hypothetical protein